MLHRFYAIFLACSLAFACGGCFNPCYTGSKAGQRGIDMDDYQVSTLAKPSYGDKLAIKKLAQTLRKDREATLIRVTWWNVDPSGASISCNIWYYKTVSPHYLDFTTFGDKKNTKKFSKHCRFAGVTDDMIARVAENNGTVNDLVAQGAKKTETRAPDPYL